ncbi:hypothetical protein Q4610_00780 [Sphingobium sp. HBC34]|uniref:Uncharacterized protein n=1 Tax=Sphingobium cyanobacteriorum TaxID=3063954 RepID=A0ABT8ZG98_9SPHN|nr:hypothetical protein [Sphingobium sp. HBC34]MDO7833569.1 hypothetical protein [Sphingobium sp. HBC34]
MMEMRLGCSVSRVAIHASRCHPSPSDRSTEPEGAHGCADKGAQYGETRSEVISPFVLLHGKAPELQENLL